MATEVQVRAEDGIGVIRTAGYIDTEGGEKILAQAQALGPHVILMDLDRLGLETMSRLRKVLPGVGIIALTLLNDKVYRQATLAAGADDVVCKAELVADLLPAIRQVTRARRRR